MEQKQRWISIIQTTLTLVFLPWLGWISATIIIHSIAIAEIRTWQQQRPVFATKEEVALRLMESQKELQEKITTRLDRLQVIMTEVDKKIGEHIAAEKGKP